MNKSGRFVPWGLLALVVVFPTLSLYGQEPDPVAVARKATEDLAAADQAVVAARNALAAARRELDPNEFNSAAYSARVSAEQVNLTKDKYDKADESGKAEALEVYELAQELAAQRKTAWEAAEKLFPQREAEAQAAEQKFAEALAAAETSASQLLQLVRQSEVDAASKLRESKLAFEQVAVAQATAAQRAAVHTQIRQTLDGLRAAEAALPVVAQALAQAAEADRPQKQAEAEAAALAYASALQAATQYLPSVQADQTGLAFVQLHIPLVDAHRQRQTAQAAVDQANQELANRVQALTQAQARVSAAQEGVAHRIAKLSAQKDLAREQEAAARAEAAKATAEQAIPAKAAELEKAQQSYSAALQSALAAISSSSSTPAIVQEMIAKAMVEQEGAMQRESEALAQQFAAIQAAADKTQAEWTASNQRLADYVAAREALDKILRQRFFRQASSAQDALRSMEKALASATQELQPKLAAWNQASANLKTASDAMANTQQAVAAQAAVVATATQAKESTAKAMQDMAAGKTTAEKLVQDTQAAVTAAQDQLSKAGDDTRAALEAQLQEKQAQAQAAAEQLKLAGDAVAAAQAAADQAAAACTEAQSKADATGKAHSEAQQKMAEAQDLLDKAVAEKLAAEQLVTERRTALDAAPLHVAVAKAAAYGGLRPLDPAAWDYAKARHLLVRAGFGGTPEQVAVLHAMGLHKAVRHLVDFHQHPPAEIPSAVRPRPRAESLERAFSGEEQRLRQNERVAQDRQQMESLRIWWLRRMIESPRPLEEKLTFFWHGQIPVQYSTVGDSYYMYLQNELFRSHAAGNFSTLLYGIAHDAAMLKYLNNDTNFKGRANENLAREIIELFSMGRDQGYTEVDIRQGARALTGYTYDPATGQFRFVSEQHDPEPKTIFGKTGNWSGDDYVRLILETPHPAKFVARQMFSFFAYRDPSLDTVEALANVLRENNYELAPMLENLFLSEEFYSPAAIRSEIKSPVQLVVGLHRDLGLKNPDYAYLALACREMGQDLFEPPSVFGWQPGRAWVTTSRMLSRYNAVAEIIEKRPRAGAVGVDVVGTLLAGKTFQNHAEVVDFLTQCCGLVPLAEGQRNAVLEALQTLPEPAQWSANAPAANAQLTHVLAMLLCTPEFQFD